MKKITCFILLLISMQSISFESQSPEKEHYLLNYIEPMFFINYDHMLDWGASVMFVPDIMDSYFRFEPLAEVGVAKKGFSSGLGGRLGFNENGYTLSVYSMVNMTNIWTHNRHQDLELGWYVNPKLGLDVTCFNVEASHLRKDNFKSNTYFSIKFKFSELCAEALNSFINDIY